MIKFIASVFAIILAVVAGFYMFPNVYWADADSGRWNGVEFRLSDVDAAETSPVGSAFGPAKCENERQIGLRAEVWMKEYTEIHTPRPTRIIGRDRHGRLVVDMRANGQDLAQTGIEAGHLAYWPWKDRKPLQPKPDWCSG